MPLNPSADIVFADGPLAAPYQPQKPAIRRIFKQVEQAVDAFSSGAGSIAKATKSQLDADLARGADVTAWVYNDPTVANNGIYRKLGASGAGSWTRILDLPFSFIVASNPGLGTPDAIQATTSIPVSSSALVVLPIVATNTASPVTVSFNGVAALTIKSNTGNNIASGGLSAGMVVLGFISGSSFRILNDQVSGAIVAAAEAAQLAAEQARDQISAMVPNAFPTTRALLKAIDTTQIKSAYLKEAGREGQFFWKTGDYSTQIALDTAEGVFIKANAIAATVGAWVRVVGDKITPMMFGAKADGVTNDYALCLLAFNVAKLLRLPFHFPTGNYLFDLSGVGTAEWDPTIDIRGAWRAIPITGDGATLSCVTIANASGIGWYIHSVSGRHWFNPKLSGLTVRGALDGTLVAFGRNDFADYPNMIDSDDLAVENSMNTANNRAVRINGMYGGSIRRPRFVSYALAVDDVLVAVNGYALECRQAEFIHVDTGGIGNALSAVRVVDGVNLLLAFTSVTMENVDFSFDHQSNASGHHKLTTCQLTNVRVAALRSTGILSNAKIVVEEPNISGGTSTGVDATSYEGILIRDRAGVTTPTVPTSGSPFVNKTGRDVEVSYWGPATVSGITVDGFSRGISATSGTFLFKAGSAGAINFTGSLNWQWTNVG